MMSQKIPLVICFVLLTYLQPLSATETFDFELKPAGIEQHVEYEAYGVVCKFTYFAEGGTKEHWTVSIKRSKDHRDVLCVIERPDGQSYLMFESISVHMRNAHVKSAKIFKEHENKLSDETLLVDHSTNTVSNTNMFKNEMSRLQVRATIVHHNEL